MPYNDSRTLKRFLRATFQQQSAMEKLQDDHLLLTDIAQQLRAWNATEQHFPQGPCIPQLVEQQALRHLKL